MTQIAPVTFANLPNLTIVDLNTNQLTNLDSSVFDGSYNLEIIDLTYNPILSTTNIQSLCPPAASKCRVKFEFQKLLVYIYY